MYLEYFVIFRISKKFDFFFHFFLKLSDKPVI